jgi:hypothetical protein
MKQIRKMAQRGLLDPEKEDPFSLFVASTNIRYCFYHETQNILGNTFGMAVLQVGVAHPRADRLHMAYPRSAPKELRQRAPKPPFPAASPHRNTSPHAHAPPPFTWPITPHPRPPRPSFPSCPAAVFRTSRL